MNEHAELLYEHIREWMQGFECEHPSIEKRHRVRCGKCKECILQEKYWLAMEWLEKAGRTE